MHSLAGKFIPMLFKMNEDARRYLPRKDLKYLQVFMSGYSNGLSFITEASPDDEGRLWNRFERHISERYSPVGNAFITLYAAGYSDEEAWKLFFCELEGFLQQEEVTIDLLHTALSDVNDGRYREMLEGVFQRPWMYLGCTSITLLSIFIQGVITAEALFASSSKIADEWKAFEEACEGSDITRWKCMWHRRFLLGAGFDEVKALRDCVTARQSWR